MRSRIVLLACFSNKKIRESLTLGYSGANGFLRHILKKTGIANRDLSPWISDFIKIFENHDEYEFHIVGLHTGMAQPLQEFVISGISYHFVNRELPLWIKICDKLFNYLELTKYKKYRKELSNIINELNPDLFILCGAENSDYSIASLNVKCPQLVILQTLLNSDKRKQLGVGTPFRRKIEKRILTNAKFFAVSNKEEDQFINSINPSATCFPFVYPTATPPMFPVVKKEYDFVFFAAVLSRFKGTTDLVKAFSIVHKKYPALQLAIIGRTSDEYMSSLCRLIENGGISDNVSLIGSFPSHIEMFKAVQKARIAVLPGITAPLNTTVREAMLLGIPTIVYGNEVTSSINKDKVCLLEAKMENVEDLSDKMIYAFENKREMETIALNGKWYAESHFSTKSVEKNLLYIISSCLSTV